MAIQVSSLKVFQNYLSKVMNKAKHHAPNVVDIIHPLAGWLIMYGKDITVREYAGEPANMLWFYLDEQKYCFHYDHNTETIKLRKNSYRGELLIEFENATSIETITTLLL